VAGCFLPVWLPLQFFDLEPGNDQQHRVGENLPSTGYSIMMSVYAITAFFSGMIIDKYGTRPAYFLGAIFCGLGFF
jgi:MFS family permease